MNSFDQRISSLVSTVDLLRNDLKARDATIAALQQQNNALKQSNYELSQKCKSLDAAVRRDNLVFSGLTATFASVTTSRTGESAPSQILRQVVEICNKDLNCSITPTDISHVQLLPSKSGGASVAGTRTCAATVKFVRRTDRDSIFFSKTKLSSSNKDRPATQRIYINEDLIPEQRKLLNDLRAEVKKRSIQSVWSKFGIIFVKTLVGDIKQINSMSDLP